jgi:hypothetical protein
VKLKITPKSNLCCKAESKRMQSEEWRVGDLELRMENKELKNKS